MKKEKHGEVKVTPKPPQQKDVALLDKEQGEGVKAPTFAELALTEQNVHNNSNAFREFLDGRNIKWKPNGHFTTVIGNIDLFWLGIDFGKYWAANANK